MRPQYIISAYPDPGYEAIPDSEGRGHVVYYYGSVGPSPNAQFHGQQAGTVNAFNQQGAPKSGGKKTKGTNSVPAPAPVPAITENGEGSSANPDVPPPTYADAVMADNKIQDRD